MPQHAPARHFHEAFFQALNDAAFMRHSPKYIGLLSSARTCAGPSADSMLAAAAAALPASAAPDAHNPAALRPHCRALGLKAPPGRPLRALAAVAAGEPLARPPCCRLCCCCSCSLPCQVTSILTSASGSWLSVSREQALRLGKWGETHGRRSSRSVRGTSRRKKLL